MKTFGRAVLLLFFLKNAAAQPVLRLAAGRDGYLRDSVSHYFTGFLDMTGEMSFEQARAARFAPFDSVKSPLGYFENNRFNLWLRCRVDESRLRAAAPERFFWYFGERTLSAAAFRVSGDGRAEVFENGKMPSGSPLPSYFLTALPASGDTAAVWYFRLKSFPFRGTPVQPEVFSEKGWLAAAGAAYLSDRWAINATLGLLAVLSFMVLFSLTQWLIHREAVFVFYAGHLLAILPNIYRLGLDFELPVTALGRFTAFHGNAVATFLGHFFYIWFVINFLGLPTAAPRLRNLMRWAAGLSLAVLAAYFFLFFVLEKQDWAWHVYFWARVPLLAFVLWCLWEITRRRFPFFGFVLGGGLMMTVGATWWMWFGYRSRVGMPGGPHPNLVFYTCAALESLVFMSGLGYKFAITEQSKRRAQERLLAERARISRDLHDDVGATLNSLALLAEVSKRQTDGIPEATQHSLDQIKKIARDCTRRVSDLVWSASPKGDSLGDLTGRMRDFSHQLFAGSGVRVRFRVPPTLDALPLAADRRWNLYLIFKEAMNNARKYAEATQVEVSMEENDGKIRLSIKDDGRGFDPETLRPGNGLLTMRERAQALGGSCAVTSRPGGGTAVEVLF